VRALHSPINIAGGPGAISAGLRQLGVDVVMRPTGGRRSDFRRGRRLGREDHLVEWHRSRNRPERMSRAEFAALPRTMEMRELRVRVEQPGFRTRSLVVVTILLDAEVFRRGELAGLYRARWYAEISHPHYPSSRSLSRRNWAA